MYSPFIVTEADTSYNSGNGLRKAYWVLKPSYDGIYVRASMNVWKELDMAKAECETLNKIWLNQFTLNNKI